MVAVGRAKRAVRGKRVVYGKRDRGKRVVRARIQLDQRSWERFYPSPDLEITTITHLNPRDQLFGLLRLTLDFLAKNVSR